MILGRSSIQVLMMSVSIYMLSPAYQTPHPASTGKPVFDLVSKVCGSGRTSENRRVRYEERLAACNALEEYEGYEEWANTMRTLTIAKAKLF